MQISTLEVLLYNYPMKILELVLDIVLLVLVYRFPMYSPDPGVQ